MKKVILFHGKNALICHTREVKDVVVVSKLPIWLNIHNKEWHTLMKKNIPTILSEFSKKKKNSKTI